MTDSRNTGPELPAFMVSYGLDHSHRVVVGVHAPDAGTARAIAQAAFDAGTLWDDTPDMPLLYDDYEEIDGQALQFDATPIALLPPPHVSVRAARLQNTAHRLLTFARLVDSRLPAATTIQSWHPEALVPLTLTAGQVAGLRTLLTSLAGC